MLGVNFSLIIKISYLPAAWVRGCLVWRVCPIHWVYQSCWWCRTRLVYWDSSNRQSGGCGCRSSTLWETLWHPQTISRTRKKERQNEIVALASPRIPRFSILILIHTEKHWNFTYIARGCYIFHLLWKSSHQLTWNTLDRRDFAGEINI